jgi:hypothetical protein
MRVARIDHDVADLEEPRQVVDHRIRTRTRLDHDQHPTRPLKRGDETGHRLRRDELAIVSMLVDQGLRLGIRPIVDRHPVPITGEVAGQVRPITANPVTPI